ncbi:putative peroxisomal half ABC transporter [Ceraceosorus guamensis]|uniref:Putative peroxisomal half ABC transporter n=1 Tax=Ceraceosorus guamensis TaxID=1522189 RepID=A0A316VMB2_9BASI|nr:putative peroxisomal half ABC transporter [Ceraceosorus guamensis]PWN38677.1 putative peroxisomal half ABC transporter [Ceraceosorus guamensis]
MANRTLRRGEASSGGGGGGGGKSASLSGALSFEPSSLIYGKKLSESEMERALEQLYIPRAEDGKVDARGVSHQLLVPHRGRMSRVSIRPTKPSTFDAHWKYFSQATPLALNVKKSAQDGQDEKTVKDRKRAEAREVRAQGGQAAATAKKVGVNKEFFRQLKAILRILIPNTRCKEVILLALHTAFLILRTYLSVLVARLDGYIVKNLVTANGRGFLRGLGLWFALAVPSTYTNSMIRYLQSKLAIGFRTRLTRYAHDLYLSPKANFYRIINLDGRVESADQYITTDIARFCETLSALYSNIAKPTLDIIIFNYQLANAIGGRGLFGLFISYYLTGRILRAAAPAFGKLAAIEAKLEGDFRGAHGRLITNAEEVAFYNGSAIEESILNRAFKRLVKHVGSIYKVRVAYSMTEDFVLKYAWSAAGYGLIAMPYLTGNKAGSADEGGSTAASKDAGVAARTQGYVGSRRLLLSVSDAGSRLMASYKDLAELAGFTSRIYVLLQVLHSLDRGHYQSLPRPDDLSAHQPFYDLGSIKGRVTRGSEDVELSHVPIVAPAPGVERGGEELVKDLSLRVKPGMHVLISGPNGVGKTAVARVLAELWPAFEGEMRVPDAKRTMFLPQKAYLTTGSLKEQIIYPHAVPQCSKTDAELMEILGAVHLAYVVEREGGFGARKTWTDVLSGGERQRFAFARLLYHAPRFGILDETSSAVSTDVEGLMYQAAKERGITLITISHRPSLMRYHTHLLHLGGEANSWKLEELEGSNEALSFEEEIKQLKNQLRDVEKWEKRVEVIKKELSPKA